MLTKRIRSFLKNIFKYDYVKIDLKILNFTCIFNVPNN